VGVSDFVVEEDSEVDVEEDSAKVDVDEEELDDSPKLWSSVSCLRPSQPIGCGLVSICISPLSASSLKCAESSARGTTGASYAETHETVARITTSNDITDGSRSTERLLPGRRLCIEECILRAP
jgi:hypothetical protein